MRFFSFLCASAIFCGILPSSRAAQSLFDFENEMDGETWRIRHSRTDRLTRSREVAAGGEYALLFTAPAWDGKTSIWPAFETRHIPRDWSKYDRLVITLYNDTQEAAQFNLLLANTGRKAQEGALFRQVLQPFAVRQWVIPFKRATRKINPADVALMHFFSENPKGDLRIFLDDIVLLKPGEPVPALSGNFLKQIRERRNMFLGPMRQRRLLDRESIAKACAKLPPPFGKYLKRASDQWNAALMNGKFDPFLKNSACPEWHSIPGLISVLREFAETRGTFSPAAGNSDILLGMASSMEKVLPRAPVFHPLPETLQLEAARREKESVQLIVMPLNKDRSGVAVRPGVFSGPAGTLPESAVSAAPVGFVETRFLPISGSDYLGFWPDVLLSFLKEVAVRAGEAQPFWIKVNIPEGQPAGEYAGNLRVMIEGKEAFRVPLSVRVRDFTLPKYSMLPLAVTFWPKDGIIPMINPNADPKDRLNPSAPARAWRKHKVIWGEFLQDFYLGFDSLYAFQNWEPHFSDLAERMHNGTLRAFNLDYILPAKENDAKFQARLERIRVRYKKAKELGLLNYAYLYGCDESKPAAFPQAERAASILKREFPGVPLFTTAYDKSYGCDGRLDSFDWFCPKTSEYNPKQAERARKAGKQVWWYICNYPHKPYANIFIESPAIEARLLMGAMAAKYRPDGFLYYQTSQWNSTKPITSGPYLDWPAESWPGFNGDGNLTYPGPDSTPLASIRLENFRDGLEDYAYVRILEAALEKAEKSGKNPQWRAKAEKAGIVPVSLVRSMREFSHDPEELSAWRKRIADLIESAPEK